MAVALVSLTVDGAETTARQRAIWTGATAAAVLTGSFANFLNYASFPIYSLVTLAAALVFSLISLPVAALAATGRLGMVLAALGIGMGALSLNDIPHQALVGLTFSYAVYRWGLDALKFATVLSIVVGMSAPLTQPRPSDIGLPASASNADLTPLVHIILDEHGSADYGDLGFSSWMNVTTKYYQTKDSLPYVLDGYFDAMRDSGYQVTIWQSSVPKICQADCMTYDLNSLAEVRHLRLHDQVLVTLGSWSQHLFDEPHRLNPWSLNGFKTLQEAVAASSAIKPGQALVVHAMVPHYPWALDSDCTVRPAMSWKERRNKEAEEAYYRQVECVRSVIADLPDTANILIHGDHGHRITTGDIGNDPEAAYHTLFAFRQAGTSRTAEKPEVEEVKLKDLLERFAASGFERIE